MNMKLRKTLLALAIASLFGSVTAYAQQSDSNVKFNKKVKLSSDISLSGDPTVRGRIDIDSAAIAIVDNAQYNAGNSGENVTHTNDASVGDSALGGASGNLGLNIGAGDNNQQDNAAALSATDASFAFGMADAEVFVNQQGMSNGTLNWGSTNTSSISGDAFSGASGNIGANVTSGNNNQQKNAMAASVATTDFAQASVSSDQASSGNETANVPYQDVQYTSVQVTLTGSGSGSYEGSGSGSANLGLSGAVDQIGDVYPDVWGNSANDDPTTSHPTDGSLLGHVDLDTETQGGSDLNGDGGALAFGYTDDSSASGDVDFQESGDLDLDSISLSGTVYYAQNLYTMTSNMASLGDNAFNGASGNIGINISAGTGNQQANSLAMAVAQPSTGSSGTPGE